MSKVKLFYADEQSPLYGNSTHEQKCLLNFCINIFSFQNFRFIMDGFGVDLDKILNEFEENEGNNKMERFAEFYDVIICVSVY